MTLLSILIPPTCTYLPLIHLPSSIPLSSPYPSLPPSSSRISHQPSFSSPSISSVVPRSRALVLALKYATLFTVVPSTSPSNASITSLLHILLLHFLQHHLLHHFCLHILFHLTSYLLVLCLTTSSSSTHSLQCIWSHPALLTQQ